MTILLEAMFGDETFDTGNAKVAVFAVPCKIYNSFDRECHIDLAAKKSDIPVSFQNRIGTFNAYNEVFRNDLGKWTQAVYRVEEGMIFKIFAHRAGGHGQRVVNASQFIRIREAAAFREVKIKLTQNPKARFSFAVIKGCFDLLTVDEAVKRGVKLNIMFKHTLAHGEVARVMEFNTITPERETPRIVRERVYRRGGEKIVIQKTRKARAIDLGE